MRLRDIIGLVIALILAIGVAFLTRFFLNKSETPPSQVVQRQPVELNKILVANKDLNQGDKVNAGDLTWQEWPQSAFNSSYIKQGAVKIESFLGSIVQERIPKGAPIRTSSFIRPGERGLLAAVVAPGKRAISIDVTSQSASSGLIFPGDYVDVIESKIITPASGSQYGQSKTIVRNAKVLAMDFEMVGSHEKPKAAPHVATLEVNPSQAELLTAAAKEGTLSLSLHSIEKSKIAEEEPHLKHDVIIIMRGKEKSEIQIQ